MKVKTQCWECGKYNQPTKNAMCDKCYDDLEKPLNVWLFSLMIIFLVYFGMSQFEFQIFWTIVGILIGMYLNSLGRKK